MDGVPEYGEKSGDLGFPEYGENSGDLGCLGVWVCLDVSGCIWVYLGVSGCIWCIWVHPTIRLASYYKTSILL